MLLQIVRKSRYLLLSVMALNFNPSFAYADWQSDLESKFDIVETFDQLQDWRGTGTGSVYDLNDMPKKLDNSPSIWGWYSYWQTYPSTQNWIDEFPYVWSGKKSLCIDMSNDRKAGPSRLGLYFGDGTPQSGYKEVYIFYMVRIPSNEWPTAIDQVTKVGTFVAGNNYVYVDSWKFGTINMGCTEAFCNHDTYSPYHIIPHIKNFEIYNMQPVLKLEPNDDGNRTGVIGNQPVIRDEWFGVEFHFKNVSEDGHNYTYSDVWMYDKDGNSWKVIDNHQTEFTSQPITDLWNSFFFGGNNSATYLWGNTMEPKYYVDDFILHGSRIGPTYFSVLKGTVTPDIKPKNPEGSIPVQ